MIILYTKDNCHYCEKVKDTFYLHKVSFEERNIKEKKNLDELLTYGVRTIPHLVDTTANVHMGESEDIIAYGLEGSF